ncbi:hypothetical protein [Robinsoniella peoriensis]|nr:hypothetical protein [Robinsoniella peoriensis]
MQSLKEKEDIKAEKSCRVLTKVTNNCMTIWCSGVKCAFSSADYNKFLNS